MTPANWNSKLTEGWTDALKDAGLEALEIHLYPFEAEPGQESSAAYFAPTAEIGAGLQGMLEGAQRAHSASRRGEHQIMVRVAPNPDNDFVIAQFRHELQHARQWLTHGDDVFDLTEAIGRLMDAYIPTHERGGSGVLYNITPVEVDANSAAAAFMATRLSDGAREARIAAGGEIRLCVEQPLGALQDLPRQTVAFAGLGPDEVEQWFARDPREVIDALAGDSDLWDDLRGDAELRRRVADAQAAVPSAGDVRAAAPEFAEAYGELKPKLLHAFERALIVAGLR